MSWEYSKYEARCENCGREGICIRGSIIGVDHQLLGKALTASSLTRMRYIGNGQTQEIKSQFVIVAIQESWPVNISGKAGDIGYRR